MCGVIGVWNSPDAATLLKTGLQKLQHRGYDASGIVTFDPAPHIWKQKGSFTEQFQNNTSLPGNCGIAQLRYTTQGGYNDDVAQPIYLNHKQPLAAAHNGNIINAEALKATSSRRFISENDLEPLLDQFLSNINDQITPKTIFNGVQSVHNTVQGGYAVVILFPGVGMVGFVDPAGIRPLFLATNSHGHAVFTSESYPVNHYKKIKQLNPGEAIWVTDQGIESKIIAQKPERFCLFESIYFSHPESNIYNQKVATIRQKMGNLLGEQFQRDHIQPDIVIDIPETAYYVAQGVAETLGIPYHKGITKKESAKRTFILPKQQQRAEAVAAKFKIDTSIVSGKSIALIDDSIVRGTTAHYIIQELRKKGAKKIYLASGAPPIQFPCFYGIDIALNDDLIAKGRNHSEIAQKLGADRMIYQNLTKLHQLLRPHTQCDCCFTGKNPNN